MTDLRNNRSADILNWIIALWLVWSIIRWILQIQNWILNGLTIFLFPAISLVAIILCPLFTERRIITPYVFFPLTYHIYMIARHCLNGDIMNHGSSDIYTLMICLVCLMSFSEDEFADRFDFICRSLLYSSIAVAVLSYARLFLDTGTIFPPLGSRIGGITPGPNPFGHIVSYGFVFGLCSFLLVPQRKSTWVLLPINAILLVKTLLDTQSRASMLFTIVSLAGLAIMYFVFWRKTLPTVQSRVIMAIILICILIVLVTLLLFITSVQFRGIILNLLRVPNTPGDSLSDALRNTLAAMKDATARAELRALTLQAWKANVLFGVTVRDAVTGYTQNFGDFNGSHNSFIQVLATLGVFGLILFVIMLLSSFAYLISSTARTKHPKTKTIGLFSIVVFIAIMIDSCFENLLYCSLSFMVICAFFIITTGYQLKHIVDKERT